MKGAGERESALSALCRHCGLCCDGTLFTSLPLTEAEAARLEARGFTALTQPTGRRSFPLRCAALRDRTCTIYEDRPSACRSYRCHQAIALAEGETSEAAARAVVDEMRAAISALEAAVGGGADGVVQRARRGRKDGQAEVEVLRRLEVVEGLMRRHFVGRSGG